MAGPRCPAPERNSPRKTRNAGLLLLNPLLPKSRRRPVPPELMHEVRFGPAIFAATLLLALARRWS